MRLKSVEDGRFKKALNEASSVEECDEYVAFEQEGAKVKDGERTKPDGLSTRV